MESANTPSRVPIRDLVLYYLRLGALGFGGPVALVGQMEKELVQERKWLTKEELERLPPEINRAKYIQDIENSIALAKASSSFCLVCGPALLKSAKHAPVGRCSATCSATATACAAPVRPSTISAPATAAPGSGARETPSGVGVGAGS